jgi:hypothetical protein
MPNGMVGRRGACTPHSARVRLAAPYCETLAGQAAIGSQSYAPRREGGAGDDADLACTLGFIPAALDPRALPRFPPLQSPDLNERLLSKLNTLF